MQGQSVGFESSYRRHLDQEQRRAVLEALGGSIHPDSTLGEVIDAAEALGFGEQMGELSLADLADALLHPEGADASEAEEPHALATDEGEADEDDDGDDYEESDEPEDDEPEDDEPEDDYEESDEPEDDEPEDDEPEDDEPEPIEPSSSRSGRGRKKAAASKPARAAQGASKKSAKKAAAKPMASKKSAKPSVFKKPAKSSGSKKTAAKPVASKKTAKKAEVGRGASRRGRGKSPLTAAEIDERMSLDQAAEFFLPYVESIGEATMQALEEETGVARRKLRFHIGQLVRHGYLERHGMGRGTYYTIA